MVDRWVQRAENLDCPPIQVVELARNVGLAEALNAGLQACSYELVARADSDDLSEPTRFARLIPALVQGGYTVLGSAMLEVNESNTSVESTREAIVDSARLLSAMDSRNPIYHPSVAFVKSAVQQLGGYEFVPGAEDWWLWMRLRDAGYRLGKILRLWCVTAWVRARTRSAGEWMPGCRMWRFSVDCTPVTVFLSFSGLRIWRCVVCTVLFLSRRAVRRFVRCRR